MVVVDFATQVGPSISTLLSSWWQNGRMVAGNPCNPMIHNLAGRTSMYTEHGFAEEAIISTDVFGTKPLWCQPWGFG